MKKTLIHLLWTGPFSLKELKKEGADGRTSYGIYQIYGGHPIYGRDHLLYIGMANEQTFAQRIAQEDWRFVEADDSDPIAVRLGRLYGPPGSKECDDRWGELIQLAERLLITAHKPAWNKRDVAYLREKKGRDEVRDIHILNWGQRGDLLPEISGDRWTSKHEEDDWRPWEYREKG